MALTKEERIIRLRRGIASPETSDALRAMMQEELDDLLKPETTPVADPPKSEPKKVVKKKPVVKVKKEYPIIEVKAPEPPVLTEEDKNRLKEEYARKKAKKQEKQED